MRILTVLGARPQFIKAAALSRVIQDTEGLEEIIVHTGQHFDQNMSQVFFDEMNIPKPDYNLDINSLSHGAMTGRMIEGIEEILLKEKPDLLLVYGDTNSTIAGALAAKKLHIKVGHVEAGLRSFNYKMPEEINRILTDRISDYLFCPTQVAADNLEKEGFKNYPFEVVVNGDVMMDAALYYGKISEEKSSIISQMNLKGKDFILCTVHRQENTDDKDRLTAIVSALNELNKSKPVILPLHPRTAKYLKEFNLSFDFETIDPIGYFDIVELLKNCALVITDSGGLQKEAFFFGNHGLILRDQTEWVELVDNGFSVIVGAEYQLILDSAKEMLNKKSDFTKNLYGRGDACNKIVDVLLK